jgi:hypothetical protein
MNPHHQPRDGGSKFLITRHDEQYILPWFAEQLNQAWQMGVHCVTANSSLTMAWRTVYRYEYRPDRNGD